MSVHLSKCQKKSINHNLCCDAHLHVGMKHITHSFFSITLGFHCCLKIFNLTHMSIFLTSHVSLCSGLRHFAMRTALDMQLDKQQRETPVSLAQCKYSWWAAEPRGMWKPDRRSQHPAHTINTYTVHTKSYNILYNVIQTYCERPTCTVYLT